MHLTKGFRRLAISLAAVLSVAAVPTPAQAVAGDGWWMLQNVNSGLFLAVAGSGDANGGRIIQYPGRYQASGQASPEQDWFVLHRGNSIYTLRNAGTPDWKAAGVSGSRRDDGAPVIQWTYNPANEDQQWKMLPVGGNLNVFTFTNVNSGSCLAMPRGSKEQNIQAIQWPCNNNRDQQWRRVDN
ncbi:RICIN domain-containing protein [Actinoplanes aureus]|uniref:RICIN domain-containing protein n=1 Tax=Actinoplanes aureus TaxID=2792083 RepID=A0A931C8F0_9ACTN|nr:RICIN domain-containing protein [Actinoplanes aureus]MBG0565359.1 RICIN domain-containing protein [Actinoplanes aureus]